MLEMTSQNYVPALPGFSPCIPF